MTRQAGRKVADGLEQQGYVTTEGYSCDTQQLNITVTQLGCDCAIAIIGAIIELNREIAGRVSPAQLATADAVLRRLFDDSTRQRASRVPPPRGPPSVIIGHPPRASSLTRRSQPGPFGLLNSGDGPDLPCFLGHPPSRRSQPFRQAR